jgi:large subunit ribosomal protein L3
MGSMRPMRVFKGKKLPGHMGFETVTIQNLEIVMVDLENNVLLVKGNVPGPKKSLVIIKTAVKKPGKINEVEELNFYDVKEPEVISEETPVVEEPTNENASVEETTEVSEK